MGQSKRLSIAVIAAAALLLSQGLAAADDKGQFGVRGAGLISCALYVQERQARAEVYLMTAAWVDGYITATNQYSADTYDIVSFETTELLAAILGEHCRKHPADRIFPVLKGLLAKLHQDRLQQHSNKAEVVVGDRKVSLYVDVLKRVQSRLATAGFYNGKIDADYGQASIDAMKGFQRSIDFKATGFPDQMTLWRLFRQAD